MKILFPVDQRATLAAGHEAPNSTELLDIPVERIPADVRAEILPLYDPEHRNLRSTSGGRPAGCLLKLVGPATVEAGVAALVHLAQDLREEKLRILEAEKKRAEAVRAATQKVLENRTLRDYVEVFMVEGHTVRVPQVAPAWPTDSDSGVTKSAEAVAWEADLKQVNAERRAKFREDKLAAIRAEEALRAARNSAFGTLVRTCGSPSQIERWEVGALPDSEREALIERFVLAPFGEYPKVPEDVLCDDKGEVRTNPAYFDIPLSEVAWVTYQDLVARGAQVTEVREYRGADGTYYGFVVVISRDSLRWEGELSYSVFWDEDEEG